MKKISILFSLLIGMLSIVMIACEDLADPLVEQLDTERAFAPTGLEASIKNMTAIELDWNVRDDADHYIVEFSQDSLTFTNIIRTLTVMPDDLPVRETFEGETLYSARVKTIGIGDLKESKWSSVAIRTDPEQLFLPLDPQKIGNTFATLNWPAGSEVTRLIIDPGNVEYVLSEDERNAGEVMLVDLAVGENYTVTIFDGEKKRGRHTFLTVRPANVFPEDDLIAKIAEAEEGAELILAAGEYVTTGTITLNKSISLIGQLSYDKPVLNVAFEIADGADAILLENLELFGPDYNSALNLQTDGASYGSITLSGCDIHDYKNQLIYGNVAASLESFTVNNCVVSNFTGGGGDFIDFRKAYVANVTLTNSTFYYAPFTRDFIRLDEAAGYSGTGLTSSVLIDHCTLYGVSDPSRRVLYVRFDQNQSVVRNTLIADSDGFYTNQSKTTQPTFSNNNYFAAPKFYTEAEVSGNKFDNSGTHRTEDPGFADALNGDLTISNSILIENQIGDPRWR